MDFYNRKLFLPIISPASSIHCAINCTPTPSPSPQQSPASNPVPVNPFVSLYYANHAEQIHLLRVVIIAVSSVLGLILLLFTILKILGSYYARRFHERRLNSPILFDIQGGPPFSDEEGPAINHPIWFINTVGLQQSVIDSIAVCKYRKSEGLVEVTECSVCLGEFQEDENLRLLPKCTHAFHVSCIDTWLRSHKNCPLCRAPVVREASGGGEAVSVMAPINSNSSGENRTAEVSDGAVVGDYYPAGEGESSEVSEDSGIMIMTSEDGEGSEVWDDKNLVNSDKLNCNSSARVLSRSDSVCSSC